MNELNKEALSPETLAALNAAEVLKSLPNGDVALETLDEVVNVQTPEDIN